MSLVQINVPERFVEQVLTQTMVQNPMVFDRWLLLLVQERARDNAMFCNAIMEVVNANNNDMTSNNNDTSRQ